MMMNFFQKHRLLAKTCNCIVTAAFLFEQSVFAQDGENSNLAPSLWTSKMRSYVSRTDLVGAPIVPGSDNSDNVVIFPFILSLMLDVLDVNKKAWDALTNERLREHLGGSLQPSFNAEALNQYGIQKAKKNGSSVILPLSDEEAYRFFLPGNAGDFESDENISESVYSFDMEDGKADSIQVRKIKYSSNVAHLKWGVDEEDELNRIIKRLINHNDGINNKSGETRYDHAGYKAYLKEITASAAPLSEIAAASGMPLKERFAEIFKDDPEYKELKPEDLIAKMNAVLARPEGENPLTLFFLEPEHGMDMFRFVKRDKDGGAKSLFTDAHFGHERTGTDGKQKIYIAARSFDTLSESEKRGLIMHDLVHLVLGDSDKVHKIADILEKFTVELYDREKNTETLARIPDIAKRFFSAKKKLSKNVKKGDWAESSAAYKELRDLAATAGKDVFALSKNSLYIAVKTVIDPKAPDDVRMKTAISVSNELIMFVSDPNALEAVEGVRSTVEGLAACLFPEPERKGKADELYGKISVLGLLNLLPEALFESETAFKDNLEKTRKIIRSLPALSNPGICGWYSPELDKVFVRPVVSPLYFNQTLIHELIHYLGDKGVIKLNHKWEFTTFAGESAHLITNFVKEGLSFDDAEKIVLPLLDNLVANMDMAVGLYDRGRELGKQGNDFFVLKNWAGTNEMAYVGIDKIISEAVDVYAAYIKQVEGPAFAEASAGRRESKVEGRVLEEHRILRSYLAFSYHPPRNKAEERYFQAVRYAAQRMAGIMLAGIYVSRYEAEGKEPLVKMKEYFDSLWAVFDSTDKEDKEWVEKELKPELKTFVSIWYGPTVSFKAMNDRRSLGLWEQREKGPSRAVIEYFERSLYPVVTDKEKREEFRVRAKESAYGNLLLSRYRHEWKRQTEGLKGEMEARLAAWKDKFRERIEKDPAFEARMNEAWTELWGHLAIPRAVSVGQNNLFESIEKKAPGDAARMKEEVNSEIMAALRSLFDLGDPEIEKDLFKVYPEDLQFLNSILWIWTHNNDRGDVKVFDPRVEKDSDVYKALIDTCDGKAEGGEREGWKEMLFHPRAMSLNEFLAAFSERIFPVYVELREKAHANESELLKKMGDRTAPRDPYLMQIMMNLSPQPEEGGDEEGDEDFIPAMGEQSPMPGPGEEEEEGGEDGTIPGEPEPDPAAGSDDGGGPGDTWGIKPPQTPEIVEDMLSPDKAKPAGTVTVKNKPVKKPVEYPSVNVDDVQRELADVSEDDWKLYKKWFDMIPGTLVNQTNRALRIFLEETVGVRFVDTDSIDAGVEYPEEVPLAGDAGEDTKKLKPRRVRVTIAVDKSISMGWGIGVDPDVIASMEENEKDKVTRILWAKLFVMLIVMNMITINSSAREPVFEWQLLSYNEKLKLIGGRYAENRMKKRGGMEKLLVTIMKELSPEGSTEAEERTYQYCIQQAVDEAKRDGEECINIVVNIGDGNFGQNTQIKEMLDRAEKQPSAGHKVYALAIPVGDNQAMHDASAVIGEERCVIPDEKEGFPSVPRLAWKRFYDIFVMATGHKPRNPGVGYDGTGDPLEDNKPLARIFRDTEARDYAFLQGWRDAENSVSDEGRKGNLFKTLDWIDAEELDRIYRGKKDFSRIDPEDKDINGKQIFRMIENEPMYYEFTPDVSLGDLLPTPNDPDKPVKEKLAELYRRVSGNAGKEKRYSARMISVLRGISEALPGIKDFNMVTVRNTDLSGHYSVSHPLGGRIYIPVEFQDMLNKYDESEAILMLSDFIEHEYLECLLAKRAEGRSETTSDERSALALLDAIPGEDLTHHERVVLCMDSLDEANNRKKQGRSVYERTSGDYTGVRRGAGYRHFYYEMENGRDYLVFDNGDPNTMTRRERGVGQLNVPRKVTVDDEENEELIMEAIGKLWLEGYEYKSYTRDGKFYIRKRDNGTVELNIRGSNGIYPEEPAIIFGASQAEWVDPGTMPLLSAIEGLGGKVEARALAGFPGLFVYDPRRDRVVYVREKKSVHSTVFDLEIDGKEVRDPQSKRVLMIEGETGLGKDEIIEAIGNLMNEEVWYLAGHADVKEGDIICKRTLTEKGTEYVYSSLNYVQHNGGIVVISEGQFIDEEAYGALKNSIVAAMHERHITADKLIEDDPEIRRLHRDYLDKSRAKAETAKALINKMVSNHPRARIIITSNLKRLGTKIKGINDVATLDRMTDMRFYWRDADSEAFLQYRLAMEKLENLVKDRPDRDSLDMGVQRKRIYSMAKGLEHAAKNLRIVFSDLDPSESDMVKADWSRWKKGFPLRQGGAAPRSPGSRLRRAPSPRVIRNIIEFAVKYPKTFELAPASVIEMFFNLYADNLDETDRKNQMKTILKAFEEQFYFSKGIENKDKTFFKDKLNMPDIVLKGPVMTSKGEDYTSSSFKWEDGYLMVTPEKAAIPGEDKPRSYWDTLKLKVHPDAYREKKLPRELLYWLKTGSGQNSKYLYQMLQLRSLGAHILLVGDQGAGKSLLAEGVCRLLSGPDYESYNLTEYTKLKTLIQTAEIVNNVVVTQDGPVVRAMKNGKLAFIDELTQGRPGMQAGLHEAMSRLKMALYNSMVEGREGFGFIFAANTPGGPFNVEEPDDAFKERCAILRIPPLSYDEMYGYLVDIRGGENKDKRMNADVIGKKIVDPAPASQNESDKYLKVQINGHTEIKYTGLIGVSQYLKREVYANRDKQILRRLPGFRTLDGVINHVISNWKGPENRNQRMNPQYWQEELLAVFMSYFKQAAAEEADLDRIRELVKNGFKEAGLWVDEKPGARPEEQEDGVLKYLDNKPMVYYKLTLIREPKFNPDDKNGRELNELFTSLQEYNRDSVVTDAIDRGEDIVKGLVTDKESWSKLSSKEKTARLYNLREIYQLLILIMGRGKGVGQEENIPANYDRMYDIAIGIIQARLVGEENWPLSFLEYKGGADDKRVYAEAWKDLKGGPKKPALVGIPEIDDSFLKLSLCAGICSGIAEEDDDDKEYPAKIALGIEKFIGAIKFDEITAAAPESGIRNMTTAISLHRTAAKLAGKYPDNEAILALRTKAARLVMSMPIKHPEILEVVENRAEYLKKLGIFRAKMGIVDGVTWDKIENQLNDETQKRAVLRNLREVQEILPDLWRYHAVMCLLGHPDREIYERGVSFFADMIQRVIESHSGEGVEGEDGEAIPGYDEIPVPNLSVEDDTPLDAEMPEIAERMRELSVKKHELRADMERSEKFLKLATVQEAIEKMTAAIAIRSGMIREIDEELAALNKLLWAKGELAKAEGTEQSTERIAHGAEHGASAFAKATADKGAMGQGAEQGVGLTEAVSPDILAERIILPEGADMAEIFKGSDPVKGSALRVVEPQEMFKQVYDDNGSLLGIIAVRGRWLEYFSVTYGDDGSVVFTAQRSTLISNSGSISDLEVINIGGGVIQLFITDSKNKQFIEYEAAIRNGVIEWGETGKLHRRPFNPTFGGAPGKLKKVIARNGDLLGFFVADVVMGGVGYIGVKKLGDGSYTAGDTIQKYPQTPQHKYINNNVTDLEVISLEDGTPGYLVVAEDGTDTTKAGICCLEINIAENSNRISYSGFASSDWMRDISENNTHKRHVRAVYSHDHKISGVVISEVKYGASKGGVFYGTLTQVASGLELGNFTPFVKAGTFPGTDCFGIVQAPGQAPKGLLVLDNTANPDNNRIYHKPLAAPGIRVGVPDASEMAGHILAGRFILPEGAYMNEIFADMDLAKITGFEKAVDADADEKITGMKPLFSPDGVWRGVLVSDGTKIKFVPVKAGAGGDVTYDTANTVTMDFSRGTLMPVKNITDFEIIYDKSRKNFNIVAVDRDEAIMAQISGKFSKSGKMRLTSGVVDVAGTAPCGSPSKLKAVYGKDGVAKGLVMFNSAGNEFGFVPIEGYDKVYKCAEFGIYEAYDKQEKFYNIEDFEVVYGPDDSPAYIVFTEGGDAQHSGSMKYVKIAIGDNGKLSYPDANAVELPYWKEPGLNMEVGCRFKAVYGNDRVLKGLVVSGNYSNEIFYFDARIDSGAIKIEYKGVKLETPGIFQQKSDLAFIQTPGGDTAGLAVLDKVDAEGEHVRFVQSKSAAGHGALYQSLRSGAGHAGGMAEDLYSGRHRVVDGEDVGAAFAECDKSKFGTMARYIDYEKDGGKVDEIKVLETLYGKGKEVGVFAFIRAKGGESSIELIPLRDISGTEGEVKGYEVVTFPVGTSFDISDMEIIYSSEGEMTGIILSDGKRGKLEHIKMKYDPSPGICKVEKRLIRQGLFGNEFKAQRVKKVTGPDGTLKGFFVSGLKRTRGWLYYVAVKGYDESGLIEFDSPVVYKYGNRTPFNKIDDIEPYYYEGVLEGVIVSSGKKLGVVGTMIKGDKGKEKFYWGNTEIFEARLREFPSDDLAPRAIQAIYGPSGIMNGIAMMTGHGPAFMPVKVGGDSASVSRRYRLECGNIITVEMTDKRQPSSPDPGMTLVRGEDGRTTSVVVSSEFEDANWCIRRYELTTVKAEGRRSRVEGGGVEATRKKGIIEALRGLVARLREIIKGQGSGVKGQGKGRGEGGGEENVGRGTLDVGRRTVDKATGKFEKPAGKAVDSFGNIWVCNEENGTFSVIGTNGKLNDNFGKSGIVSLFEGDPDQTENSVKHPSAIYIDPVTGDIYVTDNETYVLGANSEMHRIVIADRYGRYKRKLMISPLSGTIVKTSGGSVLYVEKKPGKTTHVCGINLGDEGQFAICPLKRNNGGFEDINDPIAIAQDKHGSTLVMRERGQAMCIYEIFEGSKISNNYKGDFKGEGILTIDPKYGKNIGIAADLYHGYIFLLAKDKNMAVVYGPDGSFVKEIPLAGKIAEPGDMVVDNTGNLVITDNKDQRLVYVPVLELAARPEIAVKKLVEPGSGLPADIGMMNPSLKTFDNDGNILFATNDNGKCAVHRLKKDGTLQRFFIGDINGEIHTSVGGITHKLQNIRSVAVSPDGGIFVLTDPDPGTTSPLLFMFDPNGGLFLDKGAGGKIKCDDLLFNGAVNMVFDELGNLDLLLNDGQIRGKSVDRLIETTYSHLGGWAKVREDRQLAPESGKSIVYGKSRELFVLYIDKDKGERGIYKFTPPDWHKTFVKHKPDTDTAIIFGDMRYNAALDRIFVLDALGRSVLVLKPIDLSIDTSYGRGGYIDIDNGQIAGIRDFIVRDDGTLVFALEGGRVAVQNCGT
ncbi:MAG: AAA family ATPase, partial [Candidatus Omnitrophica bacterium]|nr:AAA family ATPase [Candidatus Omnitrophota bacterium]